MSESTTMRHGSYIGGIRRGDGGERVSTAVTSPPRGHPVRWRNGGARAPPGVPGRADRRVHPLFSAPPGEGGQLG